MASILEGFITFGDNIISLINCKTILTPSCRLSFRPRYSTLKSKNQQHARIHLHRSIASQRCKAEDIKGKVNKKTTGLKVTLMSAPKSLALMLPIRYSRGRRKSPGTLPMGRELKGISPRVIPEEDIRFLNQKLRYRSFQQLTNHTKATA